MTLIIGHIQAFLQLSLQIFDVVFLYFVPI